MWGFFLVFFFWRGPLLPYSDNCKEVETGGKHPIHLSGIHTSIWFLLCCFLYCFCQSWSYVADNFKWNLAIQWMWILTDIPLLSVFRFEEKKTQTPTYFRAWIKWNQIFHIKVIQRHWLCTCWIHFRSLDFIPFQTKLWNIAVVEKICK